MGIINPASISRSTLQPRKIPNCVYVLGPAPEGGDLGFAILGVSAAVASSAFAFTLLKLDANEANQTERKQAG